MTQNIYKAQTEWPISEWCIQSKLYIHVPLIVYVGYNMNISNVNYYKYIIMTELL